MGDAEWTCPKCSRSRRPRAAARGNERHEALPEWAQAALRVLAKVMRARVAGWFIEPVDGDVVPDYYTIITSPMDLGTIKDRLLRGGYASPEEVLRDVELVWSNCRTYNRPGEVVYNDGEACASMFATAWAKQGLPPGAGPLNAFGSMPPPGAMPPPLPALGMPSAPLPALGMPPAPLPLGMAPPQLSASLAQLMQGGAWPPPPMQGGVRPVLLQPPPPPPVD